jgi:hypothetical protein
LGFWRGWNDASWFVVGIFLAALTRDVLAEEPVITVSSVSARAYEGVRVNFTGPHGSPRGLTELVKTSEKHFLLVSLAMSVDFKDQSEVSIPPTSLPLVDDRGNEHFPFGSLTNEVELGPHATGIFHYKSSRPLVSQILYLVPQSAKRFRISFSGKPTELKMPDEVQPYPTVTESVDVKVVSARLLDETRRLEPGIIGANRVKWPTTLTRWHSSFLTPRSSGVLTLWFTPDSGGGALKRSSRVGLVEQTAG